MVNNDLVNGNVLAYLGDAVMTLKVREYLVALGITKAKQLQELSIKYVSAKAQANIVTSLMSEGFLTEKELDVYHLGRNYKGNTKAKNSDIQTYKIASGYEAIWGYLYLEDNPQRICELWDKSRTIVGEAL